MRKTDLPEKFEAHVSEHSFLSRRDRVFVACSGGPDSVALLFLLREIAQKRRLRLGVLHAHHGLRGAAADADERFVKTLARELGLPCYSARLRVAAYAARKKLSIEEAAREMRYRFFSVKAREKACRKVMLAHTLDDQAETVLMRVFQGTGLKGLAGIRERLRQGGVVFVRPLLAFTKSEIIAYLKRRKIPYRIDRSNRSLRFVRNKIRLKFLPWLVREFNPNVMRSVARLPVILKEEHAMIEHLERGAWRSVIKRQGRRRVVLDREAFLSCPGPLQFRVLNRVLRGIDPASGLNFENWQKMRRCFGRKRYRHSLKRDIDLSLTPSRIEIYKK